MAKKGVVSGGGASRGREDGCFALIARGEGTEFKTKGGLGRGDKLNIAIVWGGVNLRRPLNFLIERPRWSSSKNGGGGLDEEKKKVVRSTGADPKLRCKEGVRGGGRVRKKRKTTGEKREMSRKRGKQPVDVEPSQGRGQLTNPSGTEKRN